jgi:hypothetical protein
MRQQRQKPVFRHRTAPSDAKNLVVARKPGTIEPPPQRRDHR